MANAYTAKLYDGRPQTFPEFVMSCVDVSPVLVPGDFHSCKAREIARSIEVLRGATADELVLEAVGAQAKRWVDAAKYRDRSREREWRYRSMLEQVRAWVPPTSDHDELKAFMVQQLQESIRNDCGDGDMAPPETEPIDPEAYRKERIASLQQQLQYHEAEQKHVAEEYEKRQAWRRALRESLSEVDAGAQAD